MAQSKAAVVINYTENEIAAIEILNANKGNKLSAKELGISTAILTSLGKKAVDPRPMAEGVERVVVYKEDFNGVCEHCGAKQSYKLYWVE